MRLRVAKKVVRNGAWRFGHFRHGTYDEAIRRLNSFSRYRRNLHRYLPDKWQPMPMWKMWARERRRQGLPVNQLPGGTLRRRRGKRRDYRTPERPDRFAARLCHYCGAPGTWLVEPVNHAPLYCCDFGAHDVERLDGCCWRRIDPTPSGDTGVG